jgi:hypothetical protein
MANQHYAAAGPMQPSDQRTNFIQSAQQHINAAIDTGQQRLQNNKQNNSVQIPAQKLSSGSRQDEFNIGMS